MKQILFLYLFLQFGNTLAQTQDSIPTQQIGEVEVTSGVKPSISLSTTPLQVTTSSDINRIGMQSTSDVVRRFTGVVVKDYGGIGGFKSVAIRGNGAEHTSVVYDGLAITNTQAGQIDISQFPLDNVSLLSLSIGQSDDIFRTAYAAAAVGVLNVSTKVPTFGDGENQMQVQLKAGSWGLFNPYLYYAHKLSDRFSISADGSWQRADGNYSFERENIDVTIKAKRQNSDVDIKRTEVNLYGNLGKGQTLAIKTHYYDSERGLPGAVILQGTGILENGRKERLWDRNFFTQVKYLNKLNESVDLQVAGKFTHSYTKYIIEDISYQPLGFQESRYNQNDYYLNGIVGYKLSDELSFSFAEDVNYTTLRANFSSFVSPERYSSLSALSAKYDTKRLTLVANLLATYITENVKQGTASEDRKRLSPALSLSYLPFEDANLRLRASYKNTFRVPTFNDLYYLRLGNSTLSPEKAQQYNLGTTWTNSFSETFSYFSLTGDFFYNTVKDKIIVFPSSYQPSMVNLGKVTIKGFSLASSGFLDITNDIQIQLSANYTYQYAIDVSNIGGNEYKNQIPYSPMHSGGGSLSIENPWINFGYSVIMASKSYSSTANTQWFELDGYSDHTVSLNKTLTVKDHSLRLQADVTNLFNKSYYIVKDYPMPSRGYRFSMTMNF